MSARHLRQILAGSRRGKPIRLGAAPIAMSQVESEMSRPGTASPGTIIVYSIEPVGGKGSEPCVAWALAPHRTTRCRASPELAQIWSILVQACDIEAWSHACEAPHE